MPQTDFQSVVESFSTTGRPRPPARGTPIRRVAILGAGVIGQLLACQALACGLQVSLHSVYGADLSRLAGTGSITVRGASLNGTYATTRAEGHPTSNRPAIRLCASVDDAVDHAEVIFVATASHVQDTYASLLATTVTQEQVVVVVPGRFLGAVAMWRRVRAGRTAATVAEMSAPPYLASRDGTTLFIHAVARRIEFSAIPTDGAVAVAERLAAMLPMLVPVDSPLDTGFAVVTGVVTAAPLLTNTNVLDRAHTGAILLKQLVTPALSATLLRQLDQERLQVGFRYGARSLLSAGAWLHAAYSGSQPSDGEADDDLSAVLNQLEAFDAITAARPGGPRVADDVANTLVPLCRAGRLADVPTPATETIVSLASCLLGVNQMGAGRSLESVGLAGARPADARRQLTDLTSTTYPAQHRWSV